MVVLYYSTDDFLDAYKGLTICFIIAIIITNSLLIFKKVRKGDFLYTPRSLIIISLSIGDIFLALFPLIIMARIFFEPLEFIPYCSTSKAYTTYLSFLIHFVYGLGLTVLAGELVHRYRTTQQTGKTTNNIAKSVILSSCPWIIGLTFILPLTIANVYQKEYLSDYCAFYPTQSRLNAMYVVSVILPAILAVLVCGAVMFIKLLPVYNSSPAAVTYQGPTQAIATTSPNTYMGNAAGPPHYPANNAGGAQLYPITNTQGPQQYPINGASVAISQTPTAPTNDTFYPNHGNQMFSTPSTQYPMQQYPVQQYPVQQYPVQQYPAQQYPTPQYTVQYPPPQQYITQPNVVMATPAYPLHPQNTPSLQDPSKEKQALLVVAIIYFLCVVPFASYKIDTLLSLKTSYSAQLTYISLFYLSIARSVITPIIFILVN